MEPKYIAFIKEFAEIHLKTFKRVKKEMYKNEWSQDCEKLFRETRSGIVYIAENNLLEPQMTFSPLKRTFKPEQEPIREEINKLVTDIFAEWRRLN